MRCRNCDYSLWNLKARECPECGTPFLPSEFEFVQSRVRFCCPECEQPYYGTDARGHLEPPEFDCVACGTHLRMDQTVLRPGEGVRDDQTKPDRMPWLERARRGRIRAWLATIGMSLVQPGRLMRSTPADASNGQAWWFAIVTQFITLIAAMLTGLFPLFMLPFFMAAGLGGPGGGGPPPNFPLIIAAVVGATFVGAMVFTLLFILLWGLSAHAVLRLTGDTTGGIGRTMQAICYSSGANVTTAVPCFGQYFGWIWWTVSAVLMLKDAHRVHGARATMAGLALPGLFVVAVIGLYAVLIGVSIAAAQAGQSSGGFPGSGQAETVVLAEGLRAHAVDAGGPGPEHALVLAAEERLGPGSFIGMSTGTTQADVPVLEITLAQFREQGPNRQAETVRRAAALLPDGVIAHRVGDFVFTYHGIDFTSADPGLWTVIASPDPDVNPVLDPGAGHHCGRVDGGADIVGGSPMAVEALAAQNRLRAAHGLPPLPDPATITHAAPAVGPPGDDGASP